MGRDPEGAKNCGAAEGQGIEASRDWGAAVNVAAQVIRQLSGSGRFASTVDVLEELVGLALIPEAAEEHAAALDEILAAALMTHADLVPWMARPGSGVSIPPSS